LAVRTQEFYIYWTYKFRI